MPLSEREQRLLDQMEQALYEEDPKFASTLRQTRQRSLSARHLAVGVLVFAAGLVGLLAGVATSLVALGVVGFLAMLAGVLLALGAVRASSPNNGSAEGSTERPRSTAAPTSSHGFMERIEERWRRRRDSEHG